MKNKSTMGHEYKGNTIGLITGHIAVPFRYCLHTQKKKIFFSLETNDPTRKKIRKMKFGQKKTADE